MRHVLAVVAARGRGIGGQRLLVGDMEGEMAVKEPVARPHRGPARGHGAAGRHELGHDHSTVGGCVHRVGRPAASAVDLVIEAVQVHRVRAGRGVEPAPAHGVADLIVQPLGLGPALAVDDHELAAVVLPGLEPEAHDEHPLARRRRCTGRIHDEGAGELAVDPAVILHVLGGRRAPVVVGARAAGVEAHASRGAGRDHEAVVRLPGMRGEAVQDQRRVAQAVPDRRVNDGALGHPDQGTGDLERAPGLAERLDLDARSVVRVRAEHAGPELEVEREDPVPKPAGRGAILVGEDALGGGRSPMPAWRVGPRRGSEREQTDGDGDRRVHGHGWTYARTGGLPRSDRGTRKCNSGCLIDRYASLGRRTTRSGPLCSA